MLTAAEIEEWDAVDQYEDDPIDTLTTRAVKAERQRDELLAALKCLHGQKDSLAVSIDGRWISLSDIIAKIEGENNANR